MYLRFCGIQYNELHIAPNGIRESLSIVSSKGSKLQKGRTG